MKHWLTSIKNPLLIFGFFSFAALIILAPLTDNKMIVANSPIFDYLSAIIQAKAALSEGQFPLRDTLINNDGFRYPLFQFYSPSTYMMAAFIYKWMTPNNPYEAYKILLWIALVCGGIYMYRLTNLLLRSKRTALLSGCIYLFSPFYLIVIDQLNSLNQGVALGVLPAVLFYTLKFYSTPSSIKNFLAMNISWYLLITIHLITFFYSSFTLFIILSLITCTNRKIKNLCFTLISYLSACLLAIWYLAPLAMLSKYFYMSSSALGLSISHLYGIPLLSLLSFTSNYLPGPSYHQASQILPSMGAPIIFGVGACAYLLLNGKIEKSTQTQWIFISLIVSLILFILIWSPIHILERLTHNPILDQHKWCLLSQLSWMGAIFTAWIISYLTDHKISYIHILIGMILIISSSSSWLPPVNTDVKSVTQFLKASDRNFLKIPYLIDAKRHPEYILHSAVLNENETILASASLKKCVNNKNVLVCKIPTTKQINLIELPVLYFPELLYVTINGKESPYTSVLRAGYVIAAITPTSPGNVNEVKVEFRGLQWANHLSIAAWVFLLIAFIFYLSKKVMNNA